jgi:hypothetical protein
VKIHNLIRTLAIRKYRRSFSIALASLLLASSFPVNGGTALAAAAGSDFQYVIRSTQGGDHFGDDEFSLPGVFRNAFRTYTFTLPGVNPSQEGQVILSTFHVNYSCNRFEINNVPIPVFADHNDESVWETETFRIGTNVLRAGTNANTLTIRAVDGSCGTGGELDDFVVANLVIHYRTQ